MHGLVSQIEDCCALLLDRRALKFTFLQAKRAEHVNAVLDSRKMLWIKVFAGRNVICVVSTTLVLTICLSLQATFVFLTSTLLAVLIFGLVKVDRNINHKGLDAIHEMEVGFHARNTDRILKTLHQLWSFSNLSHA